MSSGGTGRGQLGKHYLCLQGITTAVHAAGRGRIHFCSKDTDINLQQTNGSASLILESPLLCLLASEQIAYWALPLPRLSSSTSPGSQASIFCVFLSCGPCAPSFTLKGNLREDA